MKKIIILLFGLLVSFCFFNKKYDLHKRKYLDFLNFQFENISSIEMKAVEKERPYLILYIPKINLVRNVYSIDSQLNNVDKNVELLKESRVEDYMFFLVGHSGNGVYSYFNDLSLLTLGDVVEIMIDEKKLIYIIKEMYYIDKNGFMDVVFEENTLFLITCSLKYVNKQLVVRCELDL